MLLSEIAQATGIPVSTCHGVLRSLEQSGYLYFLPSREVYPTRRLLEMAQEIANHDPIATRIVPELERLRDATGETIVLAALQNDHAIYLAVVESGQTIRYASRPGDTRSLHSSALGKALLMSMPEAERNRCIEKLPFKAMTPDTIKSQRLLMRNLDESLARGYAVSRGENSPDVMAIAMPLRQAGAALAISVAGPWSRMEAKEAAIARQLKRCIDSI